MTMIEKVIADLKVAKRLMAEKAVIVKKVLVLGSMMRIVRIFVTTSVCCVRKDFNADLFSIKQTHSALSKRLQQGVITALTLNKYLRRADPAENDLEELLEKACVSKSALSTFFGNALTAKQVQNKTVPFVNATGAKTTTTSTTKTTGTTAAKDDINADEITQDDLFGDGVVDYGSSAPQSTPAAENNE